MHRFTSDSLESAGGYNSYRDPHNIFASAGVIGGWPMVVFTFIASFALLYHLLSWLKISESGRFLESLAAIYLFSSLPILFIYHIHLSLGGLADRMYWLFLGMICLSPQKRGLS
jgi:hypothetical protein